MKNFETIKNIAKKCLKCKKSLCSIGCPLNTPIPEILSLVSNEKINDACQLLFSNNLFPFVCSQLCDKDKGCLGNCILNKKCDPVKYYEVENYLSNYLDVNLENKSNGKTIAIIGSGVSGINCAIRLAKLGFSITLFEKEKVIGGVIKNSLPNFRFNDSIIFKYEEILKKINVKTIYEKEFGNNLLLNDLNSFDAIIFAMGTSKSKRILDKSLTIDAMEVLQKYKTNECCINNKNVIVIGGGNVAMDASRALKKLDNHVEIVYRRDVKNCAASINEVEDTIKEIDKFNSCYSPISVIKDENGLKLTCEKMDLVDDLTSSRKKFVSTGVFKDFYCDVLVEAVGLNADYDYLKQNVKEIFNQSGWIIDDGFINYNNQYLFATGDYFTGASSFANAIKVSNETVKKVEEILCK